MEYFTAHSEDRVNNFEMHFDDERPPIYNAEDYAVHLRKFTKMTGAQLYSSVKKNRSQSRSEKKNSKHSGRRESHGEQGAPSEGFSEMALRQFSTVSQLLQKLRTDLHLSFHSFLKEFVAEPNDGVTLLLDLLKLIQLSQTNSNSNKQSTEDSSHRQQVLRRALSDEHQALLCLKLCSDMEEGALRMSEHPSGLFTVSVCVMSNFTKSRVLALQVLARMCSLPTGHKLVADAISMLRLRFGEPVRFKFLIGMLNSFNSPPFQLACVRFLNTFLASASSCRDRVHIQCELEEAGLDVVLLNRMADSGQLRDELQTWTRAYIDVNQLAAENQQLRREAEELRRTGKELKEKVSALEASRSYMEDTQRWVEGSSDKEKHEEEEVVDIDNLNLYKSVNTVVISCNSEPQDRVRRRGFPRSRAMRVEVTDTSDSDKSSKSSLSSEAQDLKEERMVQRLEVRMGDKPRTDQAEEKRVENKNQQRPPPSTALNRCKSFFGLRTDLQPAITSRRTEQPSSLQVHLDSFVLKGDSGCARKEVKRSRSMDVLKSRVLRRPAGGRAREEATSLISNERELFKSKHEYVSNWAREAFLNGTSHDHTRHRFADGLKSPKPPEPLSAQGQSVDCLQSFYSLYFPGESLSLKPEEAVDQEPTYISMANNNNNLKHRSGNLENGKSSKYESDYY